MRGERRRRVRLRVMRRDEVPGDGAVMNRVCFLHRPTPLVSSLPPREAGGPDSSMLEVTQHVGSDLIRRAVISWFPKSAPVMRYVETDCHEDCRRSSAAAADSALLRETVLGIVPRSSVRRIRSGPRMDTARAI